MMTTQTGLRFILHKESTQWERSFYLIVIFISTSLIINYIEYFFIQLIKYQHIFCDIYLFGLLAYLKGRFLLVCLRLSYLRILLLWIAASYKGAVLIMFSSTVQVVSSFCLTCIPFLWRSDLNWYNLVYLLWFI